MIEWVDSRINIHFDLKHSIKECIFLLRTVSSHQVLHVALQIDNFPIHIFYWIYFRVTSEGVNINLTTNYY